MCAVRFAVTRPHSTCFSGYLLEGVDAALAVVSLGGQRGDVVPAHGFDDVQHGLGLVGVRRHHAGEELVAAVVAQLRGGGSVADLRDLRNTDGSVVAERSSGKRAVILGTRSKDRVPVKYRWQQTWL